MKQGKKLLEVSVARPRPADWNRDPMDYTKPRTFFDIAIDGKYVGRIEFELFTKQVSFPILTKTKFSLKVFLPHSQLQSPRAAENFRALCTGEKGRVPAGPGREGAGKALHFKGYHFYRVIDQFICQTGAEVESVYGGMFQDDEGGIRLKHDRVRMNHPPPILRFFSSFSRLSFLLKHGRRGYCRWPTWAPTPTRPTSP
jgi:Cyclophilin type peptidyl-prolyl cis-trans isomerase/CLD